MEIIFDIDGTLADNRHRQHHITKPNNNWKAFFEALVADTPILPIVYLLRELYKQDNAILLCSGRPDNYREQTVEWLERFKIPYDKLYMRPAGDHRPDVVVKFMLLQNMLFEGRSPQLVIDDRKPVIEMWRKNGIDCLQYSYK